MLNVARIQRVGFGLEKADLAERKVQPMDALPQVSHFQITPRSPRQGHRSKTGADNFFPLAPGASGVGSQAGGPTCGHTPQLNGQPVAYVPHQAGARRRVHLEIAHVFPSVRVC